MRRERLDGYVMRAGARIRGREHARIEREKRETGGYPGGLMAGLRGTVVEESRWESEDLR